jgi:DNA adenine methylase
MTQPTALQPALFDLDRDRIVNVASVPQRSPFRYPGGKTWLVPRLRQWFGSLPTRPRTYVEPFVRGGILSLTVAFERLADRVVMVELDRQVAAVWQTLLSEDAAWLADRIISFDMTAEAVEAELSRVDVGTRDTAFQTILRNRVNHGGILAPGTGVLKYGENGKGLRSRWYPETLRRRILDITGVSERVRLIQGDGLAVLRQHAPDPNAVYLIDPPYTAAGKKAGSRLYTHNELDHEELFRVAGTLTGDFLMTYDNADGVRELAEWQGFDMHPVAMKNTHHAEMNELLIGRDLDWARRASGV